MSNLIGPLRVRILLFLRRGRRILKINNYFITLVGGVAVGDSINQWKPT